MHTTNFLLNKIILLLEKKKKEKPIDMFRVKRIQCMRAKVYIKQVYFNVLMPIYKS